MGVGGRELKMSSSLPVGTLWRWGVGGGGGERVMEE